jgi:ribose/xylose/arabinose/galactoside ABC-type transport system permease subunit
MNLPKLLVTLGIALVLLGLVLWAGDRIPGFSRLGRLPGDIRWEGKKGSFYFPWVTCLVLSAVLSLLFRLFGGIRK